LTVNNKLKPFLPWLGGKRLLSPKIVERLERIPHGRYVEPFCGAGHVFFRKPPVTAEVLSDINPNLITLYRVVQRHLPELLRAFEWALVSRVNFQRLADTPPEVLTDVQRAARFLTLQKLTFGAVPGGRSFGVMTTGKPKLNLLQLAEELGTSAQRLAGVSLEHQPWDECLARHDAPETLFYLDPPYWGCEQDYGKGLFAQGDFDRMAQALGKMEGNFILSLNDRPQVREVFGGFHILPVTTRYTIGAKSNVTVAAELLISSQPLAA